MTYKVAALLVAIHAWDERGTRGDGQKAITEIEENNVRVTNETIRALRAALSATSTEPDDDPDHYITQATRLRSRLAAVNEPVHTAALLSVDTDERPTINFDDDFDKGFQL